ncbi:cortical protein marker for cell polarity-domain-containing protein [Radiomyces spectabilis]|uniref:cortical protein marker for cell polarity-domain-containing protein n=1 Tax=Radiomyces spectabilis TaxID=64574 RepID=UPI00221FFF85|nr:cortical protein marker for cell polarity-domain-containing protein [Radiomyces spectabilis]KAI8384432.1 cortical protein marker for cell polarity-domain-containing protein [Radiomyces spectabilis]
MIRSYAWFWWALLAQWSGASFVSQPTIDLEQLQEIGIAGSYSGISLYTDNYQLTQIPPNTASLISHSNHTFNLLASSSLHGSIYTTCALPTATEYQLYVGGNFTQFGHVNLSNIALIHFQNDGSHYVSSLAQGLDGPVYSLYCDTKTGRVLAGGQFVAPVASAPQYSESLAYFGGSVAVWSNNQWTGVPWKGFNGPVHSITRDVQTDSLLFGGLFDTTADGQTNHAPATQPVRVSSPTKISAGNTDSDLAPPNALFCTVNSTNPTDQPWVLEQGAGGYWQADFDYQITLSLIRLSNARTENYATKEFSVLILPSNTYLNLSYIDPTTKQTMFCSTNCMLTNDPSVEYQDFQVRDASAQATSARIVISSWYGLGAGLSKVEIFQAEIFVHAIDSGNATDCAMATNLPQSKSVTSGSWKTIVDAETRETALSSSFPVSQLHSSKTSIDFIPFLPESGFYDVYMYTPGCVGTSSCGQRTDVDLTMYFSANHTVNRTLSQDTKQNRHDVIYSGYITSTSGTFQPHITMAIAHNATKPSNTTVTVVANSIQFVKSASLSALSSILNYTETRSITPLNRSHLPWKSLTENVPYGSIVKSMVSTKTDLFIAGNFSSGNGGAGSYRNIVKLDTTSQKLIPLEDIGLNGPVKTMVYAGLDLFVGGEFTGVAGNSTTTLSRLARYNTDKQKWNAMQTGVNGPVESLHPTLDKQAILVSGEFSALLDASGHPRNQTAGNLWWDIRTQAWRHDIPYIAGTVYGILSRSPSDRNPLATDYYVGNIRSAQQIPASGFSFIRNNMSLTSFPFYPDGGRDNKVNAGVFWNDARHGNMSTTIIGGDFTLNNGNIRNVALYGNGGWTGIQANWQGNIHAMTVHHDYLYIGGEFVSENMTSLAVYDLVNKTFVAVPALHTSDGSLAKVNTIRFNPSAHAVVVAGNFTTAGSLNCKGICMLGTSDRQWNNLGEGLAGEVTDFVFHEGKLIAAGNLLLKDAAVPAAVYDYHANAWSSLSTAQGSSLPGPSHALAHDSHTKKTFIVGQSGDSTYLVVWDGQQLEQTSQLLGPGSRVRQITVLPLRQGDNSSGLMGDTNSVLLLTGFLNLQEYGNVSAALFNGSAYLPYLVASTADGDIDALSHIFFKSYFWDHPTERFLSTPIVVVISIAAALGIVFAIVCSAFGFVVVKRRYQNQNDPTNNPAAYYGKPPCRPQSLLAMLTAADAGVALTKNDDYPYSYKQYPIDETIVPSHASSTEFIKDEKLGFEHVTPPPPVALTNVGAGGLLAAGAISAATGAAPEESKPAKADSFTRPESELASGFNQDARSSPTVQREIRYSNNPFRTSTIGLAVSSDYPTGETATGSYLYGSTPMSNIGNVTTAPSLAPVPAPNSVDPSSVRWTTAPAGVASSAVVAPASMLFSNTPQYNTQGAPVHWTTMASEPATAAVVSPVSLLPPSLGSDNGAPVRWTNAGDAGAAIGTAVVAPVIVTHTHEDRSSQENNNTMRDMPSSNPTLLTAGSVTEPSSVRWTNYNTDNAVGTAMVRPVLSSMYSETQSSLQLPDTRSFAPSMISISDDFATDPDIVRWTTAPDAEKAKAALEISRESEQRDSVYSTYDRFELVTNSPRQLSPSQTYTSTLNFSSVNLPNEVEHDLANRLSQPVSGALEMASGTTADISSSTASSFSDKYDHSGPTVAKAAQSATEVMDVADQDEKDSFSKQIEAMNKSSFRLSEASTLPPLNTTFPTSFDLNPTNGLTSPESPSVRWKVAKFGSPIETRHAPRTPEAYAATVTTLSETVEPEAAAVTTATETDDIHEKLSNNNTTAVSPMSGNVLSALEGRAASKRMVEDYFSSREPVTVNKDNNSKDSKKERYRSDFRSVMDIALRNNADDLPSTEDHPHLYYAKFDFSAREHGELGFDKGDPIIVVDSSDDIWWMGYKDNGSGDPLQGVFPSNYVERAAVAQ